MFNPVCLVRKTGVHHIETVAERRTYIRRILDGF